MLVTLRADFYDRPLTVPGLGELVRDHTVAMTPLDGDELERTITHPANRVGVSVEPELVAKLVADATTNPASLPLLQYSLTELYERRDGGRMTLAAYMELGGLAGAVAGRAEELCASVADVEDVRRLFTRLVTPGEGTEDTRRRARRSELAGVPDEVVDAFGAARLLAFDHDPVTREPTVEVAHEALIRNWPRLRAWLAEDRDALRVLRHLSDSAGAWDARGRDSSELYRGARLAAATDLVAASPDRLTELESEFVGASREAADADEHRRRRTTRRLRRFAVGLSIALVCALIAGVVAVDQRRNADDAATEAREQAALAQEQTRVARARRLLSEAQVLAPENLQVALLLASEAVSLDPTIDTAGLIGLLPPRLEGIRTFGGQSLFQNVVGPDGRTVPVPAADGTIYLWDAVTGEVTDTLETNDAAYDAIFAADGRHLVTAGVHSGEVAVWDVVSKSKIAQVTSREPLVSVVPVSRDASVLLVMDFLESVSLVRVRGDSSRVLWTLPTDLAGATPSPDGKLMVAGRFVLPDQWENSLYDLTDETRPRRLAVVSTLAEDNAASTSFSPDSRLLAESSPREFRLYDVSDPTAPALLCSHELADNEAGVATIPTFSSDGQLVAVGGSGEVTVLASPTCDAVAVTPTKQGTAYPFGFIGSGDQQRVLIGGDTEIRVLSVAPTHPLATVLASAPWRFDPWVAPYTAQYSTDGSPRVLSGPPTTGQSLAWTVAQRADGLKAAGIGPTDASQASEGQVVLSRDGHEVARIDTGSRFGSYVWFTPDGRRLVVGLHGDDPLTRLGFSVFGGPDGFASVIVYDVTKPEAPVELVRHELDDRAVAGRLFLRSIDAAASPDGSVVAVASVNSREILLLDAETGAATRRLKSAVNVWWTGVDFVDDHTLAGVGNVFRRDNLVLWDTDSGQELHAQSVGDFDVAAVAVNRPAGIIAVGSADGDLTLFDAKTRTQLGPAVNLGFRGIVDLEFRDDGQRLLVAYTDAPTVEWDLSRSAWKQAVCDVVGRNLTADESRLYFDGDASHTSTCPGV